MQIPSWKRGERLEILQMDGTARGNGILDSFHEDSAATTYCFQNGTTIAENRPHLVRVDDRTFCVKSVFSVAEEIA